MNAIVRDVATVCNVDLAKEASDLLIPLCSLTGESDDDPLVDDHSVRITPIASTAPTVKQEVGGTWESADDLKKVRSLGTNACQHISIRSLHDYGDKFFLESYVNQGSISKPMN